MPTVMKHTKMALIHGLLDRQQVELNGIKFKFINRIEAEDGSGKCWNVTGITEHDGKEVTVFVRTYD